MKSYNPQDYKDSDLLNLNPFSYDNNGNYHNDDQILSEVCKMNIEEQMLLSNAIVRRYALNKNFLELQMSFLKNKDSITVTPTLIGNLAFLIYYNPDNVSLKQCHQRLVTHCFNSDLESMILSS